jgi:hypothetical protein
MFLPYSTYKYHDLRVELPPLLSLEEEVKEEEMLKGVIN